METENSILLTAVRDPFKPYDSRLVLNLEYQGKTIAEYISETYQEFFDGFEIMASVNGAIVEVDFIPLPRSSIVFTVVPAGGGGNQNLRIVASIALMIVSIIVTGPGGAFGVGGGLVTSSTTAHLIQAGIVIAGSILINALLPISTPDEQASSSSYSWSGVNVVNEGSAFPVIYGTAKILPPFIGIYMQHAVLSYTDNDVFEFAGDTSKQDLHLLCAVADHELESYDSIKINGTEYSEYENVTIRETLGIQESVSPTEEITNSVNRDFTGGSSNWQNHYFTTFNDVNELALTLTTGGEWQYAYLEIWNYIPGLDSGKYYCLTYDASGIAGTWIFGTFHNYIEEANLIGEAVEGTNNQLYFHYKTAQNFFVLMTRDSNAAITIDNISIKEIVGGQPPLFGFQDTHTQQNKGIQISPYTKAETEEWTTIEVPGSENTIIGVGVAFPNGLGYWNDSGEIEALGVNIEIQYRALGTSGWIPWINGRTWSKNSTPIRWQARTDNDILEIAGDGYVGRLLPPAEYEIRIRSSTIFSRLNSHVMTMNIEFVEGITNDFYRYPGTSIIAIDAIATDQLSGGLPTIAIIATRGSITVYEQDGTPHSVNSDNPAWACYNILNNTEYGCNISYTRINYTEFYAWASFCTTNLYTCNIVFDTTMSVPAALAQISLLGRGHVIQRGTNFGVIIDQVDSPVQMFTMGNIIEDTLKIAYLPKKDRVNAIETTFIDSTHDYESRMFELRTSDFDTDTDIEENKISLQLYGATTKLMAVKLTRFLLNCNEYLQTTAELEVQVDALASNVGDVILISHDVPQWGYSGHVISAISNAILLDREVPYGDGISTVYKIMVRHYDDDDLEEIQVINPGVEIESNVLLIGTSLGAEQIPTTENREFTVGGGDWSSSGMSFYDDTDDLSITANSAGDYALLSSGYINWSAGTGYLLYVEVQNINGSWNICDGSPSNILATIDSDGNNYLNVITVTGSNLYLVAVDNDSSGDFDNFSIKPVTGGNWAQIPQANDIYAFGKENILYKEFRITKISRSQEMRRRINALEYRAEVYADTGTIPDYPDNTSLLPIVYNLTAVQVFRREDNIMRSIVSLSWDGFGTVYIFMKEGSTGGWNFINSYSGEKWADIRNLESGKTYTFAASTTTANPTGSGVYATITISGTDPRLIHIWRVSGLQVVGQGNNTIWQNRDLKLTWNLSTHWFPEEADGDAQGAGSFPPMTDFGGYRVRISDSSGKVRREFLQTENFYDYTYEKNSEDGYNGVLEFTEKTGDFVSGKFIYQGSPIASAKIAAVRSSSLVLTNVVGTFVDGGVIYQADYENEILENSDFTNWTLDHPDSWSRAAEDSNNYVTENPTGQCQLIGENAVSMYIAQFSKTIIGQFYKHSINVKSVSSGALRSSDLTTQNYWTGLNSTGISTFVIQASSTKFSIINDGDTDITFDDVSLKHIINAALASGTVIFDSARTASDPEPNLTIQVWARNRYGQESAVPATIHVSNSAPDAPTGLVASSYLKGITVNWAKSSELDINYYLYRTKVKDDDWSDWSTTTGLSFSYHLSEAEQEDYGSVDVTVYVEVKAVDTFGNESDVSSANADTKGLYIMIGDILGELFGSLVITDSDGNSSSNLAALYDGVLDSGGLAYTYSATTMWIKYAFPVDTLVDRVAVWSESGSEHVYFSYSNDAGATWTYLKADTGHVLDADGKLIEASSISDAETNYLALTSGANAKTVAIFPEGVKANMCRMHMLSTIQVNELVFVRQVLAEQIVCSELSAIVAELGSVNITAGDGLTLTAVSGDANAADLNFAGYLRTYTFRGSYDNDTLNIITDSDGNGEIIIGYDLNGTDFRRPSAFSVYSKNTALFSATFAIAPYMYDAYFYAKADESSADAWIQARANTTSQAYLKLHATDTATYIMCLADEIYPAVDGGTALGIETTNQWSNVWADLINGADYSFLNKWRMLESDKYEGYPKGIAIGVEGFENGVVTEKMPEGLKPLFAVTKEFIEFNGIRITVNQFKKLIGEN